MAVIDLNSQPFKCHTSFTSMQEMADELRQNHFLSAPGIPAQLRVPPMHQTILEYIQKMKTQEVEKMASLKRYLSIRGK